MKKVLLSMMIVATMVITINVKAISTHNYDDWNADGFGEKNKVNDNVTNVKGVYLEDWGRKVGPFSKASKRAGETLSKGITEGVNVEINPADFKEGEIFEITVSLDDSSNTDAEITERVIMGQKVGDAVVITHGNNSPELVGWAPGFKVNIKEAGIYTLQWNYDVKGEKPYVTFSVLHKGVTLGSTGEKEMSELNLTEHPAERVVVRSVWVTTLTAEKGLNLYAKLPEVTVAPEVTGDEVTVDEKAANVLKESLSKYPELQEILEKNDGTIALKSEKVTVDKETTKAFESVVENAIVANYFDISILLQADGKEYPIEELSQDIELSVKLPELPQVEEGLERTYYILRMHGDNIEKLDAKLSEDGKTLTFNSKLFSTYAIAYVDQKPVASANTTTQATETPENPQTLDKIALYGGISLISLAGVYFGVRALNKKVKAN